MTLLQTNLLLYQNNLTIPQELKVKPLALVGFSGLDIVNNAIHKSVWETFNNRSEKAPVFYKIISNTHKFPIVKPKRNSYEWYMPKGLLKKNWPNKYLQEIPAIIVIFFDLDWKDSLWNEKMIECASKVQSMRAALEGREIRILVVLIQSQAPMPDDPLAAERALALCSSCELNSKSLYVLPHEQHLVGYVTRLENAFFDFYQEYYCNCIKNIKMHKEYLNKNTHQYLYVRHQFKMAFLNELRQDLHSAHKHYTLAYNNLSEIRILESNALEIRTVTGFINYKICKLLFALNLPRDAISQFKAHIEKFKNPMGYVELSFEHFAWLSKQFEIFADLFDEAVKLGLPAVQTQHPGIYYQQAAEYAIARKKAAQEYCAQIIAYPHPDPLEGMNKMEFYGQRPWKHVKVSGDSVDARSEANGIHAVQYLENQINHSSIIISLYGFAITQYKIYKCPRTRRHLVLQMAEECYNSNDFGKALTLFTHMLSDYREEKWWTIISNILEKALICAYLTANVQDYILLALEMLGSSVSLSIEDKRRVYENLCRILKKQIPYGDPKLPRDILQNAIILWQPIFGGDSLSLSMDLSQILTCLEVKSRFIKPAFQIDQQVSLEVFVRSTCPFPLTFTHISVRVITPNVSTEFAVSHVESTSLTFHCKEVKRFVIDFNPDMRDLNSEIEIESINISIGSPQECLANLKFNGQGTRTELSEFRYFKKSSSEPDFENIKILSKASIVPRNSNVSVKFEHAAPALVGETYEIIIDIINQEMCAIRDLKVEVLSDDSSDVEYSTVPEMAPQKLPMILPTLSTMDPNSKIKTSVFLRANKAEIRNMLIRIVYCLESDRPVISIKNETILLPIVKPFEVETKYLSVLMQTIQKFYVGEQFGVMPLLQFSSPYPICIEDTSIEFVHPVRSIETKIQSHLAGSVFHKEEVGTELYLAVSEKQSDQNLVVANYVVKWKRKNGNPAITHIPLHGYHCDWIPLNLKLTSPAHGFVRTPVIVKYHLINQSSHLVQLDVAVEASEAFMFSGYRQTVVSVLPFSTKIIQYNLYPLVAGSVGLPRLILSIPENSTEGPALRQDQLNQLIERTIPYSIYVMPQAKGNPKLPAIIQPQEVALS